MPLGCESATLQGSLASSGSTNMPSQKALLGHWDRPRKGRREARLLVWLLLPCNPPFDTDWSPVPSVWPASKQGSPEQPICWVTAESSCCLGGWPGFCLSSQISSPSPPQHLWAEGVLSY